MALIGLLAVALALIRWKANDLSLISFGIFCFVYGARTRAFQFLVDAPHIFWAYWRWFLIYLTPVPAYIFFEQFIGKGWKSSIRRIWQIQIIFVIVAVSVGLILRSPVAAMIANNVVAHRFFQNEKDLLTITHELETARQIQSFILPQDTVDIEGIYLAAHYVPMASVAGDFYDFIKVDERRLGILVADVCGHGVPAALISSMVKIAFSSQMPHAKNPARVLAGINQKIWGSIFSIYRWHYRSNQCCRRLLWLEPL